MSFIKVKRHFVQSNGAEKEDSTIIINTDKIYRIKKVLESKYIQGIYYAVYYDCDGGPSVAPDIFDRENAEKIFKAIGVSLD